MDVKPFFKRVPKTEEKLQKLKESVENNEMIFGRLVSADETVTVIVAEIGTLLSGMDALRSIYQLATTGGFDIIEDCMEKTAEYAHEAKNYKQLLETIAPIADSCTRYPSALQQLWSTAEALAVFPLERKRRKSIQKAVIVLKPREVAEEGHVYERVA